MQWDQPLSWCRLALTSALLCWLPLVEVQFCCMDFFSDTQKNSCVPLFFIPQAGARAVIIQKANGRSGHRNLMSETFKMVAFSAEITARLKVCNAVCEDEHQDMIRSSPPLQSVASLVTRGKLCCFNRGGHGDCCSRSCLYHQATVWWETWMRRQQTSNWDCRVHPLHKIKITKKF